MKNGDFAGSCMPFGWIRSFHPHPMQIVQNNEYISFLFEQSTMFQVVNTEGLPHRKDWPPTWFGDSRGRWEGDTLVIDVVNLNGYATLGTIGHPMSEQAHLVMRFKRPDFGHMPFNWVLEDPKTYTRPISNERVFALRRTSSSWSTPAWRTTCSRCSMARSRPGSASPMMLPSVVPTRWEWTSFDLTKSQTYTGVVKISHVGERQARNGESRRQRNGVRRSPRPADSHGFQRSGPGGCRGGDDADLPGCAQQT